MLPVVRRIIEVFAQVADKLETDASRVDAMVPKLPDSEREAWKETAKEYRERAANYRAEIEKLKAQHGAGDFIKPDPATVR
jgi:hypothetical protein